VTVTEVDLDVQPGRGSSLVWQGDGLAQSLGCHQHQLLFGSTLVDFGGCDYAVFNDTSTNTVVNSPARSTRLVTVDAANNYTFAGAGKISGRCP